MVGAWDRNWREHFWAELQDEHAPVWDLLVVGGGITGAGILREAAERGLQALLVEQHDFAWGTSSRSSKMVHGGLRYIAEGDIRLTRHAVTERERFLREAAGLVQRMPYVYPVRRRRFPGRRSMGTLLWIYDLIARKHDHRYLPADELLMQLPGLSENGLRGGLQYSDAVTDDARLVLRTLQEARAEGAMAANYTRAEELLMEGGAVTGVRLRDMCGERRAEVRARVVVNATGAWADRLRHGVNDETRVRPLRGSHIVFPAWRLPVFQALTVLHPEDGRPVFIYPWEGRSVVGTTDLDHREDLDVEAAMSSGELEYLLTCVNTEFPALALSAEDVIASFAGVRPVVGSGEKDPSKERRDHVVWQDRGLITVTGGKLTTFRLIARDVFDAARELVPDLPPGDPESPVFRSRLGDWTVPLELGADQRARLAGHYGDRAPDVVEAAGPGELDLVPGTRTLWAELRWAARAEAVEHLDDLMLRRTRLGLLQPGGGAALLPRVKHLCQNELGWSEERWQREEAAYRDLWLRHYSLPGRRPLGRTGPGLGESPDA
ncbi:MAG TPA: glycerol-3-phosphate dehydrogenase/oxidase [Gammaproteobacteria bacterium]|nr:glycerol-3-phosphate dehydrogenase/oxidase [Gammaproteobacteria bacterium]